MSKPGKKNKNKHGSAAKPPVSQAGKYQKVLDMTDKFEKDKEESKQPASQSKVSDDTDALEKIEKDFQGDQNLQLKSDPIENMTDK
jgi:hypothetical protein